MYNMVATDGHSVVNFNKTSQLGVDIFHLD